MAELYVKKFSELTLDELYEILKVRTEVFVVEQKCPYQEVDGIDQDSYHVFLKDDERIVAYLRAFYRDKEAKVVQIGRVLTTKRGKGLGAQIMLMGITLAKDLMEGIEIYIEAQVYAIPFYEKLGFIVSSDEFLEDGIPHVQMTLNLEDVICRVE